ncbi:MAG: hypothetical protein J7574_00935 [Flavobacterium sp.]|uniref:hypothetical protein n=1 Tax=Flavobacterium sp. TaxID=239 RepID=UPI001B0447AE|nr:hypothetical protein [Flavobacterium sp.]MBO9582701.1 hypothetical protein [Flavobacterium sp.]
MPQIKLFPRIEEVFENPSEFHKIVFFPLLTVELSSINKGNGKVHFITLFGNGDPEVEILDSNFDYNFVKFQRVGDKYKFEGDFYQIPKFEKAIEWYKEAETIYKEHKDKYIVKTEFVKEEDQRRRKINFDYYYYIKGVINYWLTRDMYLETGKFIQGNSYSGGYSNHEREKYESLGDDHEYDFEYLQPILDYLEMDLESLDFIGNLTGYNYSELGEDKIFLFVDEKKNEVLQYFAWS